jgi:hypothetical protein
MMTTFHPADGRHDPRWIARANRLRRLGRWPAWEWKHLIDGVPGSDGWSREFQRVASNGLFAVLVRPLPDRADHAMITALGEPPTWAEKQRIKDTLFGARWAVECFPPRGRLVDGADAYHLWVLPSGHPWPYDLKAAGSEMAHE